MTANLDDPNLVENNNETTTDKAMNDPNNHTLLGCKVRL